MSEQSYRLHLTARQLMDEGVHMTLASPVTQRSISTQRVLLLVLGGVAAALGLAGVLLPTADAEQGVAVVVLVVGLAVAGFALLIPAYYSRAVRRLEAQVWSYLGEDGAVVDLSPAGLALDAGPRSVRIGWGYYDEAVLRDAGLELRRRGGPVGFYPVAAFGTADTLEDAYDDVRGWIWAAGGRPAAR